MAKPKEQSQSYGPSSREIIVTLSEAALAAGVGYGVVIPLVNHLLNTAFPAAPPKPIDVTTFACTTDGLMKLMVLTNTALAATQIDLVKQPDGGKAAILQGNIYQRNDPATTFDLLQVTQTVKFNLPATVNPCPTTIDNRQVYPHRGSR